MDIVIVKVGTQVITHDSGTLNTRRMGVLVKQIAALKKKHLHVILVSSGAVGAARKHEKGFKNKNA